MKLYATHYTRFAWPMPTQSELIGCYPAMTTKRHSSEGWKRSWELFQKAKRLEEGAWCVTMSKN